jgi:hypothetical protein
MSKSSLELFAETCRHLHPNRIAFMCLNNKNFGKRKFTNKFRYWHFFEFHIARVEARRNMLTFDEVKGSIAMAELPSNVRGIKARRGAKDNFWKTIEHFHKLCFSSETREVISIVKDRTSQQEEALQVTASKHISNAENILNTYLIGYLEVLTPEEFHALHYLGYNSLFSRPVGGMSEFYVLFGPVVFCNHSDKSKIVFRVSNCTDVVLSSLSLKVMDMDGKNFCIRKEKSICINYSLN